MPRPRTNLKTQLVQTDSQDERRERFRRVAPGRISEAVRCLRKCSALGNPGYVVTDSDREQISTVLRKELADLEAALAGRSRVVLEFE